MKATSAERGAAPVPPGVVAQPRRLSPGSSITPSPMSGSVTFCVVTQLPSQVTQRVFAGQFTKRQGSSTHIPNWHLLVPRHCSSAGLFSHSGSGRQRLLPESQTVVAGQACPQGSLMQEPWLHRVPLGHGREQARTQVPGETPSV